MKKALIVGITVAVLVVAVIFLNRQQPGTNPPAEAINAANAAAEKQALSVPVDDIVLKDLQGKEVKVSDLKGKVVLLDFWATWCGPCKIEIPWLIEFQKKYGPQGFTIVGVDIDPESKKAGYVAHYLETARYEVNGQKEPINYPVVIGEESLGDKFGLDGYPTGVLISRDGHLVKITSGLVGKDEIAKDIEGQLQAAPATIAVPATR
jgi:thiol-disulfide isomerase/thioredoxin